MIDVNEIKNDQKTTDKIDALASNSLLLSDELDHADPMPFVSDGVVSNLSALTHGYYSDGNDEDVDVDEPLEMDYGSGESSEDSVHGLIDDDGQLNSNVRVLSKRTDDLVDSFRNYITDMSHSDDPFLADVRKTGNASLFPGSVKDVEKGKANAANAYRPAEANITKASLLRDFSHDGSMAHLHSSSAWNGDANDHNEYSSHTRMAYRYTWLRNKRVQRSLALVVLTVMLISISVSISATRSSKKGGLPDWNKELGEVLNEENQEHEGLAPVAGGVGHTGNSGTIDSNGKVGGGQNSHQKPLTDPQDILDEVVGTESEAYVHVQMKYSPTWFGRVDGWNGETYDEGLIFCARQNLMVPCPFEAACPGPNGMPFGGYKDDEDEAYVPIIDNANFWVDVSANGNPCEVVGNPDWGLGGGGNEMGTRHVLCCQSASSEPNLLADDKQQTPDLSPDTITIAEQISQQENEQKYNVNADLIAKEYEEADTWKPTWFDRSSGWDGRTYSEAVAFCQLKGALYVLCPYEVLCPSGPHSLPYGGTVDEPGDSWAPVSDSTNDWVQIGSEASMCLSYANVNLQPPKWGVTGQENEQITRYVMCCQIPIPEEQSLGDELIKDEYETLHPLWFDRSNGYEGETFSDAQGMCKSMNLDLCPLDVVCPQGEAQEPYGGTVDVPGGAWTPILSPNKDWVSLSSDQPCQTYADSHSGESPTWAVSGGNFESTGNVICCDPIDSWQSPDDFSKDDVPDSSSWAEINAFNTFQPQWFSRNDGWSGTSYEQAIKFCDDAGGMSLCKYEAYCPTGPDQPPLGGVRDENMGSFAPISDTDGEWIFISTINSCHNYMDVYGEEPEWSSGGKEELTRHVMCCIHSNEDIEVGPLMGPPNLDSEEAPQNELTAEENEPDDSLNPKWFGRDDGYEGKTYSSALALCHSMGRDLCPIYAVCPKGVGKWPIVGYKEEDAAQGSWLAVLGSYNNWVSLSSEPCRTYMSMNLSEPSWGTDGSNWDGTGNVACCDSIKNGDSAQGDGVADAVPSMTKPASEPALNPQAYSTIESVFEPLWVEMDVMGLSWVTYDHADSLCKSKNSGDGTMLTLCPYDAYCPMGPNNPPFQGRKDDSSTWSPYLSGNNDFVSVGQEDTCVKWTSRMPGTPNLSDQSLPGSTFFSKYILCCNHVMGISDQIDGQAQVQASPPPSPKPTSEIVPDEVGQIYAQAAQTYKPVFYNRESGYTGVSFQNALDFCDSKINNEGNQMTLCNFVSLCPLGTDSLPIGGVKTDPGGAWVPTIEKEWISVSSDTKCTPYSFLHPDKPYLGQGGGDIPQITKNVVCCLRTSIVHEVEPGSLPAPAPSINVPVVASSPVGKTLPPAFQMSAEEVDDRYQPIWYDRDSGWKGRTWQEGMDFCQSQQNSLLCPYDVYCPNGEHKNPYGGVIIEENGAWAPLFNSENNWVSVTMENKCVVYSTMHANLPSWGITGHGSEEITKHLMCCRNPDSTMSSDLTAEPEETAKPSISDLARKEIKERFNPSLHSRSDGWDGKTYMDALAFCADETSKLPCPYKVYCPLGNLGDPYSGQQEGSSGQWAPMIDGPNSWVQIGTRDTCMKYNDLNPHPPMWGLSGEGNEYMTGFIQCCDEEEDHAVVEILPMTLTKPEEVVLDTLRPIWFERKHGYQGTTHEEAELFCQSVGQFNLCPEEAYCPNGPGGSKQLYLQKESFAGEQWAPVSNYDGTDTNKWIMVGMQNGDAGTTCKEYGQLYGGKSPPWSGHDGSPELKKNVLCCLQQEALKKEQDIKRGMNPIWLDDKHGWDGGSWNDAVEYCDGLDGKKLCPYAVYCPHGPAAPVIGGHNADFNLEGEQWAPINDPQGGGNLWVQIGQKHGNSATTCIIHNELEGKFPEWGLSDSEADKKRHIQCCSF